jgi:hypothetical protein
MGHRSTEESLEVDGTFIKPQIDGLVELHDASFHREMHRCTNMTREWEAKKKSSMVSQITRNLLRNHKRQR